MDYNPDLIGMSASRRLLFLSHRLPFPAHSGADIRTFNVWKELAKEWKIDAIVVHNRAEDVPGLSLAERVDALSDFGSVRLVSLANQQSLLRTAMAHTWALARGVPYIDETFRDRSLTSQIAACLSHTRYDAVHVDSIALMCTLPLLGRSPVVLTHHNIESDLLSRRAQFSSNGVARAYLQLQARRLRSAEAFWAPRVALNICVSDEDAVRLKQIAPDATVETVPNAVDAGVLGQTGFHERQAHGVFVGGLNWFPNADALEYYASEIEPLFNDWPDGFQTDWIGKANDTQKSAFDAHRSINVVGYAPDLSPYMSQARVFIAPLRVGGGTRLKILDAWAAGVPVVATSLACEGLRAQHDVDLLIGDSPMSFVEGVRRLITDGELWRRVAARAKERVHQEFSWAAVGGQLRAHYNDLAP